MSPTLEVITGPMFSSKTKTLIERLIRVKLSGKKSLVIRPFIDTKRYEDIEAHDGSIALVTSTGLKPWLFSSELEELTNPGINLPSLLEDCDVLAIEEAQFFKHNITKLVDLALRKHKRVICAGLDMDCNGEPFGQMPWLMAKANTVTKLTAVCAWCHQETATRTQAKVVIKGDLSEAVGGAEMYEARCISCWTPSS